MKFEFAKYTDVTELYKKYNDDLHDGDGYIRFCMCLDVNDIWIARVLEGFNEEYEKEKGCYLLERDRVAKRYKTEGLSLNKAIELIKEDDFSSWDVKEYLDLEELIQDIDGGYGIN